MAYALSPGVTVVEKDFTSIVPAVSSTTGAFAGYFPWGPILYPVQLSSENELVAQFGKPNSSNFESFFTAANFLSYTSSLYITRADSTTGKNAVGNSGTAVKIKNIDDYNTTYSGASNSVDWAAKYVGTLGNSLKVSFADSATFQNLALTGTIGSLTTGGTAVTGTGTKFLTEVHVGAILKTTGGAIIGTVQSIETDLGLTLTSTGALTGVTNGSSIKADWAYYSQFDSAPGTSSYATSANATNDELHVIVIDEDGVFSGTSGTILEKFAFVSKASDAKKYDGTNNYYKDVINNTSNYIWWMRHSTNVAVSGSAWGSVAAGLTFKSLVGGMTTSLSGGVDDYTDTNGSLVQAAWVLYLDDSQYDISLLPVGKASATTANYVIQNICEVRKDCVAFISPQNNSSGAVITGSGSTATDALVTFRNAVTSSSFGFADTGSTRGEVFSAQKGCF